MGGLENEKHEAICRHFAHGAVCRVSCAGAGFLGEEKVSCEGVPAAGGVAGAFCLVAAGKERSKYASDCCDGCCECDGEYFDGDDFDADDILCNFEDTDLYDEEDEPESDEV